MSMEIRASKVPIYAGDGVELYIMDREKMTYLTDLQTTLKHAEPNTQIPPAFKLSGEHTQMLMDNLWYCGFRPTEGTGSAGSLAATERHLADMKAVAFNALKIKEAP